MSTFLIGYDLNKAGKDYDGLIDKIKDLANGWWHHLDSTWLIKSDLTCSQIRDALKPYLDHDDELLVLNITGDDWATFGIAPSGNDWLRNNL